MKPRTKWLLLGAIFIAIVLVLALSLNRTAKAQHFTAKVERGDIHDVVEATGTINAVTTVQVGSQVSGTISHLYVDFNSRVKKGQLIAKIDQPLFEGDLLQPKANLPNAEAILQVRQATVRKNGL